MSNSKRLQPSQKLLLKVLYSFAWSTTAACTAGLVSSRFTLPTLDWALISALLASASFGAAYFSTKNLNLSLGTILGSIGGMTIGGLLGALLWLAEWYYPSVFPACIAVGALFLTTWVGQSRRLNFTAFSRRCATWALVIALATTLVTILTAGLSASPALQPFLGAALGLWAMLLIVATIDSDSTRS
ncbi:MAG: hypothetical protein P4L53_09020 [Candidatus Obscuribacterales bacterium]|nr:hypothetical protein [Candidatus Obscuribacterales bacterium]